jgi:hypothetical protein
LTRFVRNVAGFAARPAREAAVQQLTAEEIERVAGGLNLSEGLKLMGEILSNVSKTRSEISMTFARNARA